MTEITKTPSILGNGEQNVEDVVYNQEEQDSGTQEEAKEEVSTDEVKEDVKSDKEPSDDNKETIDKEELSDDKEVIDKEESSDNKETPKAEEPSDDNKEDVSTEEKDILSTINEKYGTSFKDEEELKSAFSNEKISNTEEELKKANEIISDLKEKSSWKNYFNNESEYKQHLFKKQYGNEVNPSVASEIVDIDLDKVSELDVLILEQLVNTPNIRGGREGAKQLVLSNYLSKDEMEDEDFDIKSIDSKSLDDISYNKMLSDANRVKRDLKKLQDISIPDEIDFIAEKENLQSKLKDEWTPEVENILKDYNEFSLEKHGIKHSVDDSFKNEIKDSLLDIGVGSGKPPSDINKSEISEFVKMAYLERNLDSILESYKNDITKELEDKYHKETHNPKQSNEQEATKKQKDDSPSSEEIISRIPGGSFQKRSILKN